MKKIMACVLAAVMLMPSGGAYAEEETKVEHLYEKGNFASSYTEIGHDNTSRAWRDGMVGGNGETGFVTSGSPYSDVIIYQHMYFNFPSSQPREIPDELTEQLEEARENVFNLNDDWEIWDYDEDGNKVRRSRTFYYSYHPGAQLRITSAYEDDYTNYERWTNYETAEVGVRYTDKYGEWVRTTFTSREDNVTITKIGCSSEGSLINTEISIDDISDMSKSWNGMSQVHDLRYKKIVGENADYIALAAHYPVYEGSELYDGGYASVTAIVVEGNGAKKEIVSQKSDEEMIIGDSDSVKITNAEAVYLITATERSFDMTELDETASAEEIMAAFAAAESYDLTDALLEKAKECAEKYTADGKFDYDAALAPSAEKHSAEFNRLTFDLEGDEEYAEYDNDSLIALQRSDNTRINHEFMERAYNQARYAQVCCSGTSAPRLCGMWTGEWNPGWRGIYTLDANVNLQVSAMNTGNLTEMQIGYITFFLRHAPDFMENAEKAYGMHDAIQISVNADADRAMHVEYDNSYPFEYWNAGASWCLLPIYEYWQCYGNTQIEINDYMRIDNLQKVLGVEDGGLSDEEFAAIKERGWLDLEKDILLPLLTKQANFWEQIVTPRYYTDAEGNACHDESKTELEEGEKYIIIPTYSPENSPVGYTSTLTANATMDIAAARDGLDMVCAIEEAVARDGYEEAIEKWQNLKNSISDYKTDEDGALKEWAMAEYEENNNHRHLSHLYVAWPAYETQDDTELAKAANIALNNRNRYNTGDATAGHGWMHKALVEARLKRGDAMTESLLKMMNGTAYYSSMMTDHDTNGRNDTYCTDTAFGTLGAVNEALAFSNTGEIEILPALPSDWTGGTVTGLMSRSRAEITSLSWSTDDKYAEAVICSNKDGNEIKLRCGERWTKAEIDGVEAQVLSDESGDYVLLNLNDGESTEVRFTLSGEANRIVVSLNGEEAEDTITLAQGEEITLEAATLKNSYEAAEWTTDAIAIASVDNGKITARNVGSTTMSVKIGSLSREILINVVGESEAIYKANVIASYGSNAYSSSWSVDFAFDCDAATAYSSTDTAGAKYIEAQLDGAKKITKMFVIGRYTAADGDGAFANRINGAKIYASNEPMNGDISNAVLVGEVAGVTATGEYIPAEIEIDTAGESYTYYMIYFDSVNNGSAVSMAAAEIEFYSAFTVGGTQKAEIISTNAENAVDGSVSTAATAEDGEFLFELDGECPVVRIAVKKQKNAGGTTDGNYWADWVLAVGCELQGSFDGESWETIGAMNTAPDGKDESAEELFTLDAPKAYKYIRYVRTVNKTSSSYGAWLFPTDYGNRLNLAEIEIYVYNPYNLTAVSSGVSDGKAAFVVSGTAGEYVAYLAMYDEGGKLLRATQTKICVAEGENELEFDVGECEAAKLYIWYGMQPASKAEKAEN
ncbi:MAG: glycoside hydrolase family 95 protein [Clostridia bacterium]|nr:glycoside hydrolase family 95 protein [Clostridia bacterium]